MILNRVEGGRDLEWSSIKVAGRLTKRGHTTRTRANKKETGGEKLLQGKEAEKDPGEEVCGVRYEHRFGEGLGRFGKSWSLIASRDRWLRTASAST